MFLSCAFHLSSDAVWFEGCECHQWILDEVLRSRTQRRQRYERIAKDCVHKGRMALSLILYKGEEILDGLTKVKYVKLDEYIGSCSVETRTFLLGFSSRIGSRLKVRLTLKLAFRHRAPRVFCAAACVDVQYLPVAKRLVAAGLAQVDADITAGRNVDRVSVRLAVGANNIHRRELHNFVNLPHPQLCEPSTRLFNAQLQLV